MISISIIFLQKDYDTWKKNDFFANTIEYVFIYRYKFNKMPDENDKTILTDLADGQTGVIVSVAGGKKAAKRLADLGLAPGTEIEVLRKAWFSGPVQIAICGSKLVIGRGLASKIVVELK